MALPIQPTARIAIVLNDTLEYVCDEDQEPLTFGTIPEAQAYVRDVLGRTLTMRVYEPNSAHLRISPDLYED